ncbi:MAG TPA: polymer-forming cytoskeletal protein [Gemmatimonadaceae bacterium]
MALWKENSNTATAPAPTKDAPIMTPPPAEAALKKETDYAPTDISPAPRRVERRDVQESVVASDITITGKIVGAGHVRIAGKFEGDVHIEGDLTIEKGAKLTGSIRAESVAISGEVEGNIDSAKKVELLASGVINGDVKAGSLTVAAGSRMRRRAEFGWGEESHSSTLTLGNRQVS